MRATDARLSARIDGWAAAHAGEMVRDVQELVSIRSVSAVGTGAGPYGQGCRDALDAAAAMCGRYGFASKNHKYRCCTVTISGNTERQIGIFGHLDVVPEGNGWTQDPYAPYVRDGYIVGRGTADDKGPLVASLFALRCLRDLDIRLDHSLLLFMGCAEEAGMTDVTYYLDRNAAPAFSFTPDAMYSVCHGEKGILRVCFSRDISGGNLLDFHGGQATNTVADQAQALLSGICLKEARTLLSSYDAINVLQDEGRIRIEARGIAAHAAFPEGSLNAIWLLAKALSEQRLVFGSALEAMEFLASALADHHGYNLGIAGEDEISGKTTCIGGLASMTGGVLTQDINVRYAVSASADMLRNRLEDTLSRHCFSLTQFQDDKPVYTPKEAPAVRLLDRIVADFYGDTYAPYVMGGGTYARKIPNAVGFGPGTDEKRSFGRGHQPDEGISIGALLMAVKIYALSLIHLDKIV